MKGRRPRYFLFFFLLWSFLPLSACAFEIRSQLSTPEAVIAEPITYTLLFSLPENAEFQFSDIPDTLGNFTVKDATVAEKASGGRMKEITVSYLLSVFETGEQVIPPVTVRWRRQTDAEWEEISSLEQAVTVRSMLQEASEDAVLRDIRGPRTLRGGFVTIGGAILLLLAAGLLAWWRLRRKQSRGIVGREEPVVPAHEIAYRELAQLAGQNLVSRGRIKEYFIAVSGITRRYLENRFNLRAPEMTTEEFLLQAGEHSALAAQHRTLLREFLECCDLVKFA
ncbi:MAG: hypothetical protein MJA29_02365, partial [Candidatus Omnitrophica bacterium]|nr:hypothetical protein [Candidatus Omnitrophota bacterium]